MSANAFPISAARFAAALPDLPLSSIHNKAAELRNSIAHLQNSNFQLQSFADEGDADCEEAMRENDEVIERMKERIRLLKAEVERRGSSWHGGEGKVGEEDLEVIGDVVAVNGVSSEAEAVRDQDMNAGRAGDATAISGRRIGDEELARRLGERVQEQIDDGDGVYL